MATTGRALPKVTGDQLGSGTPGWLQKAGKKRGEQTGPSPVDRGKCGTALHLACDGRAMPLGVVVTQANANDGCQTQDLLAALIVAPPVPTSPLTDRDERCLPIAQGDGAYENRPARQRANAAGFRLQAPS